MLDLVENRVQDQKEAGDFPASTLTEALPLYCNVPAETLYANIQSAIDRGHEILKPFAPHPGVMLLVGGGPSAEGDLEEIRQRKKDGAIIFALNGAGLWLQSHGIIPDGLVVLDARPLNARFVEGLDESVLLLIATQCDPAVFEAGRNHQILAWHPSMNGQSGVWEHRATVLIGGSTTVGMRALRIIHVLGFRVAHLYGYDSSVSGAAAVHHAYPQPENEGDRLRSVVVDEQEFWAPAWMIRQADDFRLIAVMLMEDGLSLHVHGSGLLPTIAREMVRKPKQRLLKVYYDLALAPASYDAVSTLAVAEQRRIEMGLDGLSVFFVPGYDGGFMMGGSQPEVDQRWQMFYGIAIGLCRCLPSVKAFALLQSTADVPKEADEFTFPEGYCRLMRVPFYGITRVLNAHRKSPVAFFEAPEWMRKQVRKWVRRNTITITLREASYVDGRNSLLDEWIMAAYDLQALGYHVVFVRDTERAFGQNLDGFDVCHEASYDMAVRLALYEAAALNLFSATGPFTLGLFAAKVRGVVFGLDRSDGQYAMDAHHWEVRGVPVGSEFPNTQGRFKIEWKRETSENIVGNVLRFLGANPQGMVATYDLAHCPASFDFIPWLIAAEMERKRRGELGPLRVFFAPGPRDGFRDDALPMVDRQLFLDNVLRPALRLVRASEALSPDGSVYRETAYTIRPIVEAVLDGGMMPILAAPGDYKLKVAEWLAEHVVKRPVVIVLREASHWPERNSKIGLWERLAGVIRGSGHDVVFVRDTEKADADWPSSFLTCPEASRDLQFQIALYERAHCVLATSAPGFIALFTKAPCLIFPVMDMADYPPSTDAWWKAHHGIGHGEQFPWSRGDQRLVWTGENYPSIKTAWDEFEASTKQET